MIVPRTQARMISMGAATAAVLPARGRRPHGVVPILGEWREAGRLRRSEEVCQVSIVGVLPAPGAELALHELTDTHARAAGFEHRGELARWWRERYERVPEPASEDPWPEALPEAVRVVEVSLDIPVWLARESAGYTTEPRMALLDAGESVPSDYQSWLAEEAVARNGVRRLDRERRRLKERKRLLEEIMDGEVTEIDHARQVASINAALDAIERKQRRGRVA